MYVTAAYHLQCDNFAKLFFFAKQIVCLSVFRIGTLLVCWDKHVQSLQNMYIPGSSIETRPPMPSVRLDASART